MTVFPGWETDEGNVTEQALHISRDVLFNKWHIDPKLLDQPANPSSHVISATAPVPTDTSAVHPCLPKLPKQLAPCSVAVSQKCKLNSLATAVSSEGSQSTLDSFFKVSSLASGTSLNATKDPTITKHPESRRLEPALPTPECAIVTPALSPQILLSSDFSSFSDTPGHFTSGSPFHPTTLTTATTSTTSRLPLINLSTRRAQCVTGETRSQQLFSIATGIPPESLVISGEDQFYLFMEMRAEFGWLSYQMTSRKWVDATNEYNRRLILKLGPSITKNPQALLQLLSRIECRLIERIIKDDYKSKRNSEAFWRRHCSVIQLIKVAPSGKKPRKVLTCSRCQTIMYPGPKKAAVNHKRGVCADGVKSKLKEDEALPPWPQPQGIFSGGNTFHSQAFLNTVKAVYDQFIGGSPFSGGEQSLLILEAQAFAAMLKDRTVITGNDKNPSMALFRLYPGFEVDGSMPDSRMIQRDGASWLRISFLEEDLRE
ncbi:hypothetical protein EDC04DRAFT_872575 [Pisolithus marmoratus]|nr:hypothetical protein EDC04DRAFT_872575 [Pisolithus marmoratus]